jgi:UDP-N-acetylmuramyl pentapeptide phosphotransferase/UDP-N-acetylglucosamine-1-phosphate transferase
MLSSRKEALLLALGGGLLILFLALALFKQPAAFHPLLAMEVPGDLRITFLNHAKPSAAECRRTLDNLRGVVQAACQVCRITAHDCLRRLNSDQARWLSDLPLDIPSARLPAGIAIYQAGNLELAREACLASEQETARRGLEVTCYPPLSPRPLARETQRLAPAMIGVALLALVGAAAAAWLMGLLIVRYEDLHAHLSHDPVGAGPQKFHTQPTPRIGGAALYVGMLGAGGIFMLPIFEASLPEYGLLLLAAVPAFFGGYVEDITKKVGVYQRLLLTMVSAALCAWLLGAILPRVDVPIIDDLLLWTLPALLFTVFAVSGVTNGMNIIDGYNGLAVGCALLVLSAMAWVSAQVGDVFVFTACLALIGALLGFLAWNWPAGRIFLGDGGAYLLGFLLAELSVLLVVRNPEVSPWFPLALLIYPVFETLFSIYRRRILRRHGALRPDALHLHQLIYGRVVNNGKWTPADRLARNNRVAPYLWTINLFNSLWAIVFWRSVALLLVGIGLFCVVYLALYRRIARLRVPVWLIRRPT